MSEISISESTRTLRMISLWSLPAIFLFSANADAAQLYQAVVSLTPQAGEYATIQQALANAPKDSSPYTIYIKNGTYHERLNITRPNVHWIGQSEDGTIISANTAAGNLKPDGKKWGTHGSSTVEINAPDFSAQSLTIQNDFDFPANATKADNDPSKLKDTQAVALLLAEKSDRADFYHVSLVGYQDTLYAQSGRSYFKDSKISGTIDFIFGGGTAVFDHDDIITRARHDSQGPLGYVTAPSTDIKQAYGLVFLHSHLMKESDAVPPHSYGLGRPWHPTTTFSDGRYANPNAIGQTVYIDCTMDNQIYGWDKMSGKDKQGKTTWFYPDKDARFSEYHSRGAGSAAGKQRPQLSAHQASQFTLTKILDGWQPTLTGQPGQFITGQVMTQGMHFPAHILLQDSEGKQLTAKTDAQGHYQLSAVNLVAPLLISASEHQPVDCLRNDIERGICVASFVPELTGKDTTANINPMSDLILSELATAPSQGKLGPQQLFAMTKPDTTSTTAWSAHDYQLALQHYHQIFDAAWQHLNLAPAQADPVQYPASAQPAFRQVVNLLHLNRSYDTPTGQVTDTQLTDPAFIPVAVSNSQGVLQPFDLIQAQQEQKAIAHAPTRIFLIGDSTGAIYDPSVFPRTGWGQVFQQQVNSAKAIVVDAARSGRSSRDYRNEGWFAQVQPLMKRGDYMFIQMGHNDEKCDGSKGDRGHADVSNLCTYPNSATGKRQAPAGHPDMSFQTSLEHYIHYAKQHGLHAVLLTPTTRVQNAHGKNGEFPVAHTHFIKQNKRHGYAFVGDYSQTIIQTAKENKIPLLDIEQATIQMVNQLGPQHWKDDWLAVDPNRYPYYADGKTGSKDKPDTTHLQRHGAQAIAKLVHDAIEKNGNLQPLAHLMI